VRTKRYGSCRETRTLTKPVLIVALLSLGTYTAAVAQQSKGPQADATAQPSQAAAGVPSVVVMENLPQATTQVQTPRQSGAVIALPRPQTGLTEAQWKALKARAAKLPDPNGRTPHGEGLSPSRGP
jgi:hypothetical protein